MTIRFTRITSHRGPLRKAFSLDGDGKLKHTSGGKVSKATAELLSVEDLAQFAAVLSASQANQAFTYGITGQASVALGCQKSEAVTFGDAIARDRQHFQWPETAILLIDCDSGLLTWQEADKVLSEAWFPFGQTARLYVPSNGADIFETATGRRLSPCKFHAYLTVTPGERIPALLEHLEQRLWELGHGRIGFAITGAMTPLCLLDTCTAQPERLDFVHPAKLAEGLERRTFEPVLLPGSVRVNLPQVFPPVQGHNRRIATAKLDARPESQAIADAYKAAKIAEAIARGEPVEAAKAKWSAAVSEHTLIGAFEIVLSDGSLITVDEILEHPEDYEGQRCADPLDYDYRSDNRVAVIYPRNLLIFSHAHGGMKYNLMPSVEPETADDIDWELPEDKPDWGEDV